jgi:hypothetical protein
MVFDIGRSFYMMRNITVLTMLIFVSACQTTSAPIGSGPIELSYQVRKGFENYLRRFGEPGFFAVSADGKAYASYGCYMSPGTSLTHCNLGMSEHLSIEDCEKRSKGSRCALYAIGKKVVWKNAAVSKNVKPEIGRKSNQNTGSQKPSNTTSSGRPTINSDVRERLNKIKELLSDGTITKLEYDNKRREIIDGI